MGNRTSSVAAVGGGTAIPLPPGCLEGHVAMYGRNGNGWADATFRLFQRGELVADGGLSAGGFGWRSVCVLEGTCYELGLSGGDESRYDEIEYAFVDPYGRTLKG